MNEKTKETSDADEGCESCGGDKRCFYCGGSGKCSECDGKGTTDDACGHCGNVGSVSCAICSPGWCDDTPGQCRHCDAEGVCLVCL